MDLFCVMVSKLIKKSFNFYVFFALVLLVFFNLVEALDPSNLVIEIVHMKTL
jgi:hypothetical protein